MYISRLKLDMKSRKTLAALSSPAMLHGAVETSEAGKRTRKLWRIDRLHGECCLLLVSAAPPLYTDGLREMASDGDGWETKDYEPHLAKISAGSWWRFRIVANPTYSKSMCVGQGKGVASGDCPSTSASMRVGRGKDLRGRVHAETTKVYQEEWLMKRAASHGFRLEPDGFRVVASNWQSFFKGKERHRVTLLSAAYEGILAVDDADIFREMLRTGLGRGKAYGMGMMTVARWE